MTQVGKSVQVFDTMRWWLTKFDAKKDHWEGQSRQRGGRIITGFCSDVGYCTLERPTPGSYRSLVSVGLCSASPVKDNIDNKVCDATL
jgi:hypothetical protein